MEHEVNPYEAQRQLSGGSWSIDRLRLGFFIINFGAAVALGLMAIVGMAESVAGGGSPFEFLGGLCCIRPNRRDCESENGSCSFVTMKTCAPARFRVRRCGSLRCVWTHRQHF